MPRRARSRGLQGCALLFVVLLLGLGGTASSGCGSGASGTAGDAAIESNDERITRDALPDDEQRADAAARPCTLVFQDPFTAAWDSSWTKRAPTSSANVDIASTETRSPPTALHLIVDDDSGIGFPGAALTREIRPDGGAGALTTTCASISFAMKLSACDSVACSYAALAPRNYSSVIVFAFLTGRGVGIAKNDNVQGCPLCNFTPLRDEAGKTLMDLGPNWYDVVLGFDARSNPPVAHLELRSGDKTWRAALPPKATEGLTLDVVQLEIGVASPGVGEVWFDDFSLGRE